MMDLAAATRPLPRGIREPVAGPAIAQLLSSILSFSDLAIA